MANKHFDLIVIGGGPAGYVGAIRAAQLGMSVACVERDKLGGVCLNWGCIPTKALLANAELYEKVAHESETWGLSFEKMSYDWSKVIGRSRDAASKLNKGIAFLFKKNKIEHFQANAKIISGSGSGGKCTVELADCEVQDELTHAPAEIAEKPRETITAENVLVATGSVARDLPFARFDGDRIMGAREAMNTKECPEKLIIIGSGAIGMEFGYFYNAYGTEVTVLEMVDRILPLEDPEISKAAHKHFKKSGMDLRTSMTATNVEKTKDGVKVTVAPVKDGKPVEDQSATLDADKLILAIGVKGKFDGLFDESLGLEVENDWIKTDYAPPKPGEDPAKPLTYRTSIEGIYAVGDVIGPPALAHVASDEAIVAVERIAGHDPIAIDYSVIPSCTYCHPQVASVGFNETHMEQQGMKKGEDYTVGSFPLQSHGKAIASNTNVGLVKIIRGLPRGEILGAHIFSDVATELIAELTLARRLEATTEELNVTVHAHPTMHEAVREASLASEGKLIHG